ncbi:hypothetical protein C7999DRAFT_41184 [Corynascus novoguineensis]|uniref:Uncharacterized protein n=1 Tax=Corynascus novoguineensis TaxID=1126955 RepID=A0AAN7HJ22_9PEZI|nr:hypothetical protein C7999DRAFT_41184 [Corynascus novoguineensis]
MSYEMSNQGMSYPYPPPAAAVAVAPPKSRFSKWWPLGFFIAAILMFIIGGALVGAWSASYDCYYSSSYYSSSCDGNSGLLYGGAACFVIGGLLKLTAWILLIIWCVKRSTRNTTSISYNYQPLNYAGPAPTAAPVAPAAPAPLYQNGPAYQNAPPYQSAASPAPQQKTDLRYCGQCGSGTTSPYCPQCGIKV